MIHSKMIAFPRDPDALVLINKLGHQDFVNTLKSSISELIEQHKKDNIVKFSSILFDRYSFYKNWSNRKDLVNNTTIKFSVAAEHYKNAYNAFTHYAQTHGLIFHRICLAGITLLGGLYTAISNGIYAPQNDT